MVLWALIDTLGITKNITTMDLLTTLPWSSWCTIDLDLRRTLSKSRGSKYGLTQKQDVHVEEEQNFSTPHCGTADLFIAPSAAKYIHKNVEVWTNGNNPRPTSIGWTAQISWRNNPTLGMQRRPSERNFNVASLATLLNFAAYVNSAINVVPLPVFTIVITTGVKTCGTTACFMLCYGS